MLSCNVPLTFVFSDGAGIQFNLKKVRYDYLINRFVVLTFVYRVP